MKFFISFLFLSLGILTYAQEIEEDSSSVLPPTIVEDEIEEEPILDPTVTNTEDEEANPDLLDTETSEDEGATPILPILTPTSTSKETKPKKKSSNEEGDGIDKNFGPVFDGLSVSASAGINVYFGDVAAYNVFPRKSQFGDHITGAFKFSVARDIKWGFGGKLNFQRGSLTGTRKTGKNSSTITFENDFFDISLQVRYILSDALFKKNKNGRFKLYSQIGFGSMWYRSQLYDTETLNTKDFEGYIEVENTQGVSQKTLSDKTSKARTWVVPYGLTLVFKYNHKLDLHIDFTQNTAFTDRLDAFARSWTAKDKYNYIGIGLTYNFNRTADDAPKKRKEKEEKEATTKTSSTDKPTKSNRRTFLGRNKSERKTGDDDELLNIRLKLFETQLKLFEMQYLLGK